MNTTQKGYNSMAKGTICKMQCHKSIWKEEFLISNTVSKIMDIFHEIELKDISKKQSADGLIVKKKAYRMLINSRSKGLQNMLRRYVIAEDQVHLLSEYNILKLDVLEIIEDNLLSSVNNINKFVNDHFNELKAYGLTEAMMNDYIEAIEGFTEYKSMPQKILANKKNASEQLNTLFTDLKKQFGLLDKYMSPYLKTNPLFFEDYHNSRIISDNPIFLKSILGTVKDADEPTEVLRFVKITVRSKNGTIHKNKIKSTSSKGCYHFKGLPEGNYSFTFEKNNYDTIILDSQIHNAAAIHLNVQMKKNSAIAV